MGFNASTLYDYGAPGLYPASGPTTQDLLYNSWNLSVVNMSLMHVYVDAELGTRTYAFGLPDLQAARPFEQWVPGVLEVRYSDYFAACAPRSCTYFYFGPPTAIQLLTTVLGLLGGLSTVLYWFISVVPADVIGKYCRVRRPVLAASPVTDRAGDSNPLAANHKLRQHGPPLASKGTPAISVEPWPPRHIRIPVVPAGTVPATADYEARRDDSLRANDDCRLPNRLRNMTPVGQ
jgi:hypothetical protein